MRIQWAYHSLLEERSNSINARRLVLLYLIVKGEPGPDRHDRMVARVPSERLWRNLLACQASQLIEIIIDWQQFARKYRIETGIKGLMHRTRSTTCRSGFCQHFLLQR